MWRRLAPLLLAVALVSSGAAQKAPPKKGTQAPPAPAKRDLPAAPQKTEDAESTLQHAIEESGNDRVALVRNLEDYLRRFPDTPRKTQVYRALVESSLQLRDNARALDYAERLIALRPDDSAMMLFAVDLLERRGDEHSLTKAIGYITRVLDRVEKAGAEEKPARLSMAEWESEQKKLAMSVYLIRGRLEMQRKNYDRATTDLETSFRLLQNAPAALRLGEIAEMRKAYEKAIEHYLTAFVLPDNLGAGVDRREVRRKLGNLWRLVHGSEAGLGEQVLAAYDRIAAVQPTDAPARNPGASEISAFVLRRLEGEPLKLAQVKGKVLVLNFWATWCLPCRELEPLFEQVAEKFRDNADVVFLAVNGDEDESRVLPYLQREKISTPVVFADGLDSFLAIRGIPTVIVLDRTGKIVFRAEGFSPNGFVQELGTAIERALAPVS